MNVWHYAVMVLSAVILALFISNKRLASINETINDQLIEARTSLSVASEANSTNIITIAGLRESVDACLEGRRVDEAANAQLALELQDVRARHQRELARARANREEIYREPSCAELGDLDIAAACPAIAERVRDQAYRLDQNGDRQGRSGSQDSVAGGVLSCTEGDASPDGGPPAVPPLRGVG